MKHKKVKSGTILKTINMEEEMYGPIDKFTKVTDRVIKEIKDAGYNTDDILFRTRMSQPGLERHDIMEFYLR